MKKLFFAAKCAAHKQGFLSLNAAKCFVLMFAMLTFSTADVQGQRIRNGYEWLCESPPAPLPPTAAVPTLCEKNPFTNPSKVISIGKGTQYPTSADLIAAYSATIVGREIEMTGDFEINQKLLLRNCKVKASKDKGIVVNPNRSLRSIGCKFFCCDDMWNGIYVNTDAALTVMGTEIEDAYKAVYATDLSSVITITTSTFNRNQVGCYFESTQPSGGILALPAFWGNTFSCTSKLNIKSGYQWALRGIFISNLMVPTLGDDTGGDPNLYTGRITCGIEAENNSTIIVSNSKFVRIDADEANLPDALLDIFGYGIKCKDGNLKVIGLGSDKKVANFEYTFDNNAGGAIYTDASSVNVSQCGVRSVIENNNSLDETVNLFPNDVISITNNKKAEQIVVDRNYFLVWNSTNIVVVDKSNGGTNTISQNTFDFNNDVALTYFSQGDITRMIVLNNANTQYYRNSFLAIPRSNSYILNNIFNSFLHSQKFDGIVLNGGITITSEKLATNNIIGSNKFNDFCGRNAITLNGTSKTRVSQNNVAGYTSGLAVSGIGVYVNGTLGDPSSFNTICINAVDYTDVNFRFDGVCSENQFSRNLIYRSKTAGLFLRSNTPTALPMYEAVIGQQFKNNPDGDVIAYKNEWLWNTKTSPTLKPTQDALFQGSTKPKGPKLSVKASQFKIDNQNSNYPDAPKKIIVPTNFKPEDWFAPIDNFIETFPNACEGMPVNKVANANGEGEWNTLDESILQGEYGSNYAVTDWEAKRFLYKRMLAFPAILENNVKRITFYKTMQGTNVEKYTQIKNALDRSFDIDSQNATDLDTLITQQSLIASSMKEYISSMGAQYGDEQELPDFVHNVINAKSKGLIGISNKIKAIRTNIDSKRQATLKDLYAQSESLEFATAYEKDYKTVYSLWLKAAIQNGELSKEDLNKLREIARKCITESGSSVLNARDLLPRCERVLYPDDYNCSGIETEPISKIAKNNNSTVAYPTPADNILYLSLYELKNASKLNITDVNGRIVLTSNVERANSQIEVSNLENGLYLIHIQDNDGNTVKTEKIIVQH